MSVKMKIRITQDILNKSAGCGGDESPTASNCAFALAVRDLFPHAHVGSIFWSGGEYSIYPFNNEKRVDFIKSVVRIPITSDMQSYINKFDKSDFEERKKLPTQDFELDIPDRVLDYIDIQDVYKILEESPTLELVS